MVLQWVQKDSDVGAKYQGTIGSALDCGSYNSKFCIDCGEALVNEIGRCQFEGPSFALLFAWCRPILGPYVLTNMMCGIIRFEVCDTIAGYRHTGNINCVGTN